MTYRNHRGEVGQRRVIPERVWFGQTDWHPGPQWLLDAFDLDRRACRSFAVKEILSFEMDREFHVSDGSRTPESAD